MILLEVRRNFQRLSFLVKIVALLLVVINLAYALYFFGYSGISAGGTWYFDFTQPLRFSAWYLPIFLIVISGLLKQRSIFEQIRFTTEQKFKVDLLLILLSMIMILAVTVLPVAIIVLIRFSPIF
ncbi:hypothetical protein D7I46_12430 [Lactococcus allomyrinae]|uniref:Uncharacterized protein n=2 Tax=Lactococcus allomyrinae TaxID=2419773 RepID=A0A387BKR7_9LACT|nr:hypothetical protein D7I46_12430 [Lactococcus allomyrinae]